MIKKILICKDLDVKVHKKIAKKLFCEKIIRFSKILHIEKINSDNIIVCISVEYKTILIKCYVSLNQY